MSGSERLVDSFGRIHRDLRISVTDRCNFRCVYCMPADGLEWLPRSEVLSFEEIHRLARLSVERFGVSSIRLTGGEPTVRANLSKLVSMLSTLDVDLAMTTNGATLGLLANELASAGLRRINISLDTLQPGRFKEMTRRNDLHRVLDGIAAAQAAGLSPVKVNVVVMRGVNDDELVDFAEFGRTKGVEVRFIEFMPLDADASWSDGALVSSEEIIERISAVYPLDAEGEGSSSAPASRFRYSDGNGSIGVVASVTRSFCGNCDRVRITADGMFRNCLFALAEQDLRTPLRSGASDDELAEVMLAGVRAKGPGHSIGKATFIRPARSMSQIGG